MSKQGGLGDNLYIDGNNVSGDIGSLDTIASPMKPIEVTGIDKSGHERIGGLRDGNLKFTAYFNAATGQVHSVLRGLPTTDRILTYCRGTALGNPAAMVLGKQINYDGKRGTDGSYTFSVDAEANAYGLEWGVQLTAGMRTDTAATNGAAVDQTTVSTAFGWQAYLQHNAMTGTDYTVKLQDSADNSTWADLTSGAFAQITATTPKAQRLAVGGTAVVRRYIRAVTITTGGFTSATFAVQFVRNLFAVTF